MILFIISYLFNILYFLLIVRAIMSWVVRDTSHPIAKFIYRVTEPILMPMREVFSNFGLDRMGIDFSFLATLVLLQVIQSLVFRILINVGV